MWGRRETSIRERHLPLSGIIHAPAAVSSSSAPGVFFSSTSVSSGLLLTGCGSSLFLSAQPLHACPAAPGVSVETPSSDYNACAPRSFLHHESYFQSARERRLSHTHAPQNRICALAGFPKLYCLLFNSQQCLSNTHAQFVLHRITAPLPILTPANPGSIPYCHISAHFISSYCGISH